MTKTNRLFLILLTIFPLRIYGEIIPTYSINSTTMNELLPIIDNNSLVLINIHNTIITPKSKMFRYNENPYIYFEDQLRSLGLNSVLAKLIQQRQMALIETRWPDFITTMKKQGALVLGITEVTDADNLIENYPIWLYRLLQRFNINFTSKVNEYETFRFDNTDINSSIFYMGIVFCKTNKVNSLMKFVQLLPKIPTKIIIFENNKVELKRFNEYLSTIDVPYYGIEYLGWQQITGSPLIEEAAKLQQNTLLNTGEWIEDIDAENILKSQIKNEQ